MTTTRADRTIARIDAVITEAGRPEPVYVQCIGPGCNRSVFTWLDPACSPYCARRAAGRQHPRSTIKVNKVEVHNGIEWRSLPIAIAELADVRELEPSELAEHDQAVLDAWCSMYPSAAPHINALSIAEQRELAQQLRPVTPANGFDRARECILELHRLGQLGYLAASDEWIDFHGEPLIPPLQPIADRLAREGELPEFAEWFPAPTVEPQPRVDAYDVDVLREQIARVHGADVELLGDCPPRPPEPPPVRRPLVDPRGMIQAHTPWWKRVLRRG